MLSRWKYLCAKCKFINKREIDLLDTISHDFYFILIFIFNSNAKKHTNPIGITRRITSLVWNDFN